MYVVYSKENCPKCVQAKAILDSAEVAYEVVFVDAPENADTLAQLLALGHRSMPQIYIQCGLGGGAFVAGAEQGLLKMLRAGTLK